MKTFTKGQLNRHALELFRRVKESLPPSIAERLRCNRGFTTHGSYLTLYNFDVWDGNQTDVLDRKHFKYCLGYDRRPGAIHDGYFHLWLNTIRIYRERQSIVATLDRKLPRVVPREFKYKRFDRAISIGMEFDYPRNLETLPDLLLPRYTALISAVHPILLPLIDQFTTTLDPGERRAVVAKRGRIGFTLPGVYNRQRVREYSRSIPPTWRAEILLAYGYRCANPRCRADLRAVDYHIDHIVAFSKGGATTRDNLQPLCGPCNLAKGNRE